MCFPSPHTFFCVKKTLYRKTKGKVEFALKKIRCKEGKNSS